MLKIIRWIVHWYFLCILWISRTTLAQIKEQFSTALLAQANAKGMLSNDIPLNCLFWLKSTAVPINLHSLFQGKKTTVFIKSMLYVECQFICLNDTYTLSSQSEFHTKCTDPANFWQKFQKSNVVICFFLLYAGRVKPAGISHFRSLRPWRPNDIELTKTCAPKIKQADRTQLKRWVTQEWISCKRCPL